MNTEALIRLADKLEGVGPYAEAGPVPATQFDIREWFRWSVSGENVDPTHCGFAACAWGWAATDEWFRQRGLHTRTQGPKTIPAFGYSSGFAAAEDFFGITLWSAEWLFASDAYGDGCEEIAVTPAMVAQRIRQFVTDGGLPGEREAA